MIFWYIAVVNGVVESGYCVAQGYWGAVRKLNNLGELIFVWWSWSSYAFLVDLRDALKELRVMVGGGVRLEEGFGYIGRSQRKVSCLFRVMFKGLIRGDGVKGVMQNEVSAVDGVLAGILSVCDSARGWGKSVENAIVYLDGRIKMIECVRNALLYPILVMTVLGVVLLFYLSFLEIALWLGCLICTLVGVVWLVMVMAFLMADKIMWGNNYVYAYYFSSLGVLMKGGASLQGAMDTLVAVFADKALENVREKVLLGVDFHVALLEISEVASRVIQNGERGGGVAAACKHVGDIYLEQIERGLVKLNSLFGPLILGVVGLVLVLMISVLGIEGVEL